MPERVLRLKELPPLPMFRTQAGDHLPRHTIPDQVRESHTQTPVEQNSRDSSEMRLIMPIPTGVELSPRSHPRTRRTTASARAPGWNSTAGFNEIQRPGQEGSPCNEFFELPAQVPMLKPQDEVEAPRRPSSTDTPLDTSMSSSEDVYEHRNTPPMPGSYPTGNTIIASHEDGESSPSAPVVAPPGMLPAEDHALTKLGTKMDDLKGLLTQAMSVDQRLVEDIMFFSKQAQLCGRNEALEELQKSLCGRAKSKHIGTAEKLILKRESEAVYAMTTLRDSKESAESRIRDTCEARESMLAEIKQAVEALCELSSAAIGAATCGTDIISTRASASSLGPPDLLVTSGPEMKRAEEGQSHEKQIIAGQQSISLMGAQQPLTLETKRPKRRRGLNDKSRHPPAQGSNTGDTNNRVEMDFGQWVTAGGYLKGAAEPRPRFRLGGRQREGSDQPDSLHASRDKKPRI